MGGERDTLPQINFSSKVAKAALGIPIVSASLIALSIAAGRVTEDYGKDIDMFTRNTPAGSDIYFWDRSRNIWANITKNDPYNHPSEGGSRFFAYNWAGLLIIAKLENNHLQTPPEAWVYENETFHEIQVSEEKIVQFLPRSEDDSEVHLSVASGAVRIIASEE